MIVDCAVYEGGERRPGSVELDDAYDASRADGSAWVWIGLYEPGPDEFDSVAREFELHELAVEDAINAHQRPKLEVYGDTLFVVLKTARYIDETETVEIGEILLFVGRGFIVSVRHGSASDLHPVRLAVEKRPDLLRCGPGAVLHAILDKVVDDYAPVLAGVEVDIEELEREIFSSSRTNPTQRIYELKAEVLELHRATHPLMDPLQRLAGGDFDIIHEDLRNYFRDVYDHAVRTDDEVENFRELLNGVLGAGLSQVTVRQNDDMRKITAWAAIIAIPTVVSGVYGMNFHNMPELSWSFGYPLALVVIVGVCVALYLYFKRVGWL